MRRPSTTRELRDEPGTTPLADAAAGEHDLVLGRYRLERRIGAGGHGAVWRGFDEKLEREVAVKAIPRDEGWGEPRAEREARVAARLNHPGIVALYELGGDADAVYLVSELVRGRTLAELEAAGAVSDRDVARIGVALGEALSHAHQNGVIHRDVKPQNVIVVAEPAAGAGFAKLTDFGVAHLAEGDSLTRTGDVVGTLGYMAPEQAEGRRVTAGADVYALALVLYEGWTGLNPSRGGLAARARRGGRRMAPLRRLRRDLPAELCGMIDAALDPRPERRPPLAAVSAAVARAEGVLSDEGGLVEPGTLERLGLARAGRASAVSDRARGLAARRWRWLGRFTAGLGTGLLVLAGLTQLGPPPVAPAGGACVAAAMVALLPRLGWLAAACGMCVWLATPEADREGTALVLAAALAPTPLLLPRAGVLWSVPALAPLLGIVGLAPLFVALAGLASTAWRRAGLAIAGFVWLAIAEVLTAKPLLFGTAKGTAPPSTWEDSFVAAAQDALYPAISSPVLAPLVVWALFAAVLPLLVRGRHGVLDWLGGALWGIALVAAHAALGDLLASTTELGEARGALAGAAMGVAVAVAAATTGLRTRGLSERVVP